MHIFECKSYQDREVRTFTVLEEDLQIIITFEKLYHTGVVEVSFDTIYKGNYLSYYRENQLPLSKVKKVLKIVMVYTNKAIIKNPKLQFVAYPTSQSRDKIYRKANLPITYIGAGLLD